MKNIPLFFLILLLPFMANAQKYVGSFYGGALGISNTPPNIATNGAGAANGTILIKTGDKMNLTSTLTNVSIGTAVVSIVYGPYTNLAGYFNAEGRFVGTNSLAVTNTIIGGTNQYGADGFQATKTGQMYFQQGASGIYNFGQSGIGSSDGHVIAGDFTGSGATLTALPPQYMSTNEIDRVFVQTNSTVAGPQFTLQTANKFAQTNASAYVVVTNGTITTSGTITAGSTITTSGSVQATTLIGGRRILAKTSNTTLNTSTDVGTLFNNNGASGGVTNTLPTAVTGLTYEMTVVASQQFAFKAGASDVIRYAGSVSSTAGTISGGTPGMTVCIACAVNGTWTVISAQAIYTAGAISTDWAVSP